MKDIRFYDLNFNLILIEPAYLSISYCERLNGVGSFEIHLPPTSRVRDISLPCMAVYGDFCGIVTGLRLSADTAVFGRTLNFLLSKRVCLPFEADTVSGNELLEMLTASYISDFAAFEAGEDFTVPEGFAVSKPTALLDVITRLCGDCGHGVYADFSNKKFLLKYLPTRRNPNKISADCGTAGNIVRTVNYAGYAGCGKFGDIMLETDSAEGVYRWEAILTGDTEDEALSCLKEKKPKSDISAEIHRLIYGKDYFLGDILILDNATEAILTEINADCDENGKKFTPTLIIHNA